VYIADYRMIGARISDKIQELKSGIVTHCKTTKIYRPAAVHVPDVSCVRWQCCTCALLHNLFTVFRDAVPSSPNTQNCKSNRNLV